MVETITETTQQFKCQVCGKTYDEQNDAQECEARCTKKADPLGTHALVESINQKVNGLGISLRGIRGMEDILQMMCNTPNEAFMTFVRDFEDKRLNSLNSIEKTTRWHLDEALKPVMKVLADQHHRSNALAADIHARVACLDKECENGNFIQNWLALLLGLSCAVNVVLALTLWFR